MERLWDAIFRAVRISGDGKAVEKWQAHLKTFTPGWKSSTP